MDLNKVLIVGRLTSDPQLRTIPSGQQVANFSIATNRVWKDKSGAKQEEVEYHNVVVWGRQAEVASQFLIKGAMVLIEGRLRTRTWQNQQGQNQKTTEIISERMQLGPRPAGKAQFVSQSSSAHSGLDPLESKTSGGDTPAQSSDLPQIDINEEDVKPEDLPF